MSDNNVVDFGSVNQPKKNQGNGGGDDLEARVAKLESSVEYIQRDIADIKGDIKGIRTELKEQRELHHKDFRVMFGALITVALGLAGLMAKGFGWL
ncbi:hypothetical protein CWW57_RS00960 [Vibrio parahaemolyticus]|uniref:hypothetical protein n=1 Tax=Vibrio parahaemolyticus TaxID=670 RepID=UPI000B19E557|nr:hypothetical protein [Vibrio parahaemolyticus]EIV8648103.1 hypothetical protein [Vibrio parahaemolyticus]EJE4146065.1 hypothetical protein [Vibrio parahaemolyticus]EJE4732862.1 hypothetical protein [Vibrio parahaemolyticus]EJG1114324.1 hypothetical protein [Vibrio parahaemolyticus]ELB2878323.1 hypothetical protein [Vibrio parahaemolyticus]